MFQIIKQYLNKYRTHFFLMRISFFILESGVQYHYPDLGLITVRPADSINHLNKSVWQI